MSSRRGQGRDGTGYRDEVGIEGNIAPAGCGAPHRERPSSARPGTAPSEGKPTRGGHRSAPVVAGDKQRSCRRLEASGDRQSRAGLPGRRTASTRGASSPVSWDVSRAGLLVRTTSDVLGATGGRRWGGRRRLRTLASEFETWRGASRTRRVQRHRRRGRTDTGGKEKGRGGRRERETRGDGERNGRVTAAQRLSRARMRARAGRRRRGGEARVSLLR